MFGKLDRVAITGLGIISCLGNDCTEVTNSLKSGHSGITLLDERKSLGFSSCLSGVIRNFEPESYLSKKQRKTLPEYGIWAWAAIKQALDQAGISIKQLHGDCHTGLIFGNDSSSVTVIEQVDKLRVAGETRSIGSGHIFRSLTSTITLNISTMLGIRGMSWTVSSACASGAMAIGQGAELIASGRQKRIICGGAQEISWQSMCSFDALEAFSKREDDPAGASRPFDCDRDGLVPSGGAAAVILESFESVKKRDGVVLGEVLGYGMATDGHHIVVPSGKGIEQAMRNAIQDAKVHTNDIDVILAHATSTPAGDAKEAQAICDVFGSNCEEPVVIALKCLTGHEFWMTGAAQLVYGMLMAQNNFVAGNRNLETPDRSARKLNLPRNNVAMSPGIFLSNASGFGGTNATLIFRSGEGTN